MKTIGIAKTNSVYNQQSIDYLKQLLAEAEKGEILEILVVSKLKNGEYQHCYTGCADLYMLVGNLNE